MIVMSLILFSFLFLFYLGEVWAHLVMLKITPGFAFRYHSCSREHLGMNVVQPHT